MGSYNGGGTLIYTHAWKQDYKQKNEDIYSRDNNKLLNLKDNENLETFDYLKYKEKTKQITSKELKILNEFKEQYIKYAEVKPKKIKTLQDKIKPKKIRTLQDKIKSTKKLIRYWNKARDKGYSTEGCIEERLNKYNNKLKEQLAEQSLKNKYLETK